MKKYKPIIAITMGDPSGIGPEIAVKALLQQSVYESCRPIIVGDAGVIMAAVKLVNSEVTVKAVTSVEEALFKFGTIEVFDLKNIDMNLLEYGKISDMAGKAGFEAVKKTIELAMDKKVDATVTGPINKEAINLAGYHYSGHTEIYAEFTGTKNYTMLLVEGSLRIVHVSTHVSLRQACDLVKRDRVLKMIKLANEACIQIGISNPRIAVAGLNPHCGENGLFGSEDEEEIAPAVKEARELGINGDGPIPADTVFSKAKGGQYDIVVAMYHDQGHIPLKLGGFNWNEEKKKWDSVKGVNITLGIPIIRTSVDHGTAFDVAGKGVANEDSMLSAIHYAIKLAAYQDIKEENNGIRNFRG